MNIPKYPWEFWFNGEVHTLVHGRNFDPTPANFRKMLHSRAGERGKRVRTIIIENTIVIVARDKQRAAEVA